MLRLLAPIPVFFLLAVAALAQAPQPGQPKTPRVDQLGDPLPEGALARLGTTRFRHGGRELLGFSTDGKTLLFAGGGSVQLMDAATGKETKTVRFSEAEPRNFRGNGGLPATISGDTKVLAFASQRGNSTISIIDTATGKELKHFTQNDLFKNNLNFYQ